MIREHMSPFLLPVLLSFVMVTVFTIQNSCYTHLPRDRMQDAGGVGSQQRAQAHCSKGDMATAYGPDTLTYFSLART